MLILFGRYVYDFLPSKYNTETVRAIIDRIGRGTLVELVMPFFMAIVCTLLITNRKIWLERFVFFIVLLLSIIIVVKGVTEISYQTIKTILKPSYLWMQKDIKFLNSYPFDNGSNVFVDQVTGTFMSFENKRFNIISDKRTFLNIEDNRIFNPIFNDAILSRDIIRRDIHYIILNTQILPLSTLKKFDNKPEYFKKIYQKHKKKPENSNLNNLLNQYREKNFIAIKDAIIRNYKSYIRALVEHNLVIYRVNKAAIKTESNDKIVDNPFNFKKKYLDTGLKHYRLLDDNMRVKEISGFNYLNSNVVMIDFLYPLDIKEMSFRILQVFPVLDSIARTQVFLINKKNKDISLIKKELVFREDIKSKTITIRNGYHNVKAVYFYVYGKYIDDRYNVSRFKIKVSNNECINAALDSM